MTYPDHYLLSYGGTICEGAEVWVNNIRMWSDTPNWITGMPDEPDMITDIVNDLKALAANASSAWSTDTVCRWVKLNRIGPDGRYASSSESNTRFLTGANIIAGVASATIHPPQISLAITFRTGIQRGRASRGRIFAPRPSVPVSVNGQISNTNLTNISAAYRTFIQNLGNWPGIDTHNLAPAIVSGVGAGAASYVRSVEVGSVLDTQRRRRSALVETRVAAAVPNPGGAP